MANARQHPKLPDRPRRPGGSNDLEADKTLVDESFSVVYGLPGAPESFRVEYDPQGSLDCDTLLAISRREAFVVWKRRALSESHVGQVWYEWVKNFDLATRKGGDLSLRSRPLLARDAWECCFGSANLWTFIAVESFVRHECHRSVGVRAVGAVEVWCVMMAHLGISTSSMDDILFGSRVRYGSPREEHRFSGLFLLHCVNGLGGSPALPRLFELHNELASTEGKVKMDIIALDLFRPFWGSAPYGFDSEWKPLCRPRDDAILTNREFAYEDAREILLSRDNLRRVLGKRFGCVDVDEEEVSGSDTDED